METTAQEKLEAIQEALERARAASAVVDHGEQRLVPGPLWDALIEAAK